VINLNTNNKIKKYIIIMESDQFKSIRAKLEKTQKEIAQLLGVSIKAIHSYEQGWRKIPHHVERQLLFLLFKTYHKQGRPLDKCWDILGCPDRVQKTCPAWEFNAGDLCWFINGTKCSGNARSSWNEKMEKCQKCKVFKSIFQTEKGI
jgi:DNA-binding XRE family transcriptional regulator